MAATTTPLSQRADDGRHARRHQNRLAVLDALVQLYEEGDYEPRSAVIAERAGLSPRSLFRYFDDIDDLSRAAIDQQLRKARPLVEIGASPADPTSSKIGCLVASRLLLFTTIAPAARAARINAPRNQLVADQIREGREYLRWQLADLFAAELKALGPVAAARALAVIDVLCSFESHELLVEQQFLTADQERAALASALVAVLDPERGS